MNKSRRFFLYAIVALVLCLAIIAGTTFAWYTDDVTLKDNKVQAGTLDVDLLMDEMTNGVYSGKYSSIAKKVGPVFDYDKWEPGYSDAKKFQIVNKGDLALKYSFEFVINSSYTGLENQQREENGATDTDLYQVLQEFNANQKLENALQVYVSGTNVGTLKQCLENKDLILNGNSEYLLPNSTTDLGEVKVILPTDTDNSYENASILFDVRLYATQYTYEYDGFGYNQYDAMADYPAVATFNPVSAHTTQDQTIETSGAIKSAKIKANAVNSIFDDMRDTNASSNNLKLELDVNELGTKTEDNITYFDFTADMNATMVTTKNNVTTVTNMAVTSLTDYAFIDIYVGKDLIFVNTTHKGQDMEALASKTDIPTNVNGGYYYDYQTGILTIVTNKLSPFQAAYKQGTSFSVDGDKFIVLQGTTWTQFVASNTDFVIAGSRVIYHDREVNLSGSAISSSAVIAQHGLYYTELNFTVYDTPYILPLDSKFSDFLEDHSDYTATDNGIKHIATGLLVVDEGENLVTKDSSIINFEDYGLFGTMTVSNTNFDIHGETFDKFVLNNADFSTDGVSNVYYLDYLVTNNGTPVTKSEVVLPKTYDLYIEFMVAGQTYIMPKDSTINDFVASHTDFSLSGTDLYYGTNKVALNNVDVQKTDDIVNGGVYVVKALFYVNNTSNVVDFYLNDTFGAISSYKNIITFANSNEDADTLYDGRVLVSTGTDRVKKNNTGEDKNTYYTLPTYIVDGVYYTFKAGNTWNQEKTGGDTNIKADSSDNVKFEGVTIYNSSNDKVSITDLIVDKGVYHSAPFFILNKVKYEYTTDMTWQDFFSSTDNPGLAKDGSKLKLNNKYVVDPNNKAVRDYAKIVSGASYTLASGDGSTLITADRKWVEFMGQMGNRHSFGYNEGDTWADYVGWSNSAWRKSEISIGDDGYVYIYEDEYVCGRGYNTGVVKQKATDLIRSDMDYGPLEDITYYY